MEEKININNRFKSKNEPILIFKIESLWVFPAKG